MDNNTLITYLYTAMDAAGRQIKGEIQAKSMILAKIELRGSGLSVKKIDKQRKSFFDKKNKKIIPGDIAVFSRQLATMIDSGIPLVQSLDIVAKGHANKKMSALVETIKHEIEIGSTLAEALTKHPAHFNALFCNLVDAGENSGSLDIMLNKIAVYKEKIESIKKKIKKAMTYPLAVLVVALIITAGLLLYVVPQFESLFKGFGAELPVMTQIVIDMSAFMQTYWYYILGLLSALIYALIYARKNSSHFAYTFDRALLKFPILGIILEKAAVARFARTLGITFAAGLPLVDALKSVAGATGNLVFSQFTEQISKEVSTGNTLNSAMTHTRLFPSMVVQMVAIGEESGTLEKMLGKVADFFEEEVDNAVDALSSLLEPLIMSVLGVLIGGLVVAMYLPIFKLGSVV